MCVCVGMCIYTEVEVHRDMVSLRTSLNDASSFFLLLEKRGGRSGGSSSSGGDTFRCFMIGRFLRWLSFSPRECVRERAECALPVYMRELASYLSLSAGELNNVTRVSERNLWVCSRFR